MPPGYADPIDHAGVYGTCGCQMGDIAVCRNIGPFNAPYYHEPDPSSSRAARCERSRRGAPPDHRPLRERAARQLARRGARDAEWHRGHPEGARAAGLVHAVRTAGARRHRELLLPRRGLSEQKRLERHADSCTRGAMTLLTAAPTRGHAEVAMHCLLMSARPGRKRSTAFGQADRGLPRRGRSR